MNCSLRIASGVVARRGLHRQQAHDLEEVVLDDVADRARLVVERPSVGHIERLGHVDLDAGDVVPIPDRLQERVGEPEVEQVLHRLFAQVVVDPEDVRLGEGRVDGVVEGHRRREVVAERLLNDDPRALRAARRLEVTDHHGEQRRRNGEIVQWMASLAQLPAQGVERVDVVVRALDVAQAVRERPDHGGVRDPVGPEALPRTLLQAVQVARAGHPDDRHVQAVVTDQRGERREDLLEGEVTGGPEEDDGVGGLGGPGGSPGSRAGRHGLISPCLPGARRSRTASRTGPGRRSPPRPAT